MRTADITLSNTRVEDVKEAVLAGLRPREILFA